jgi:hypothetical protein
MWLMGGWFDAYEPTPRDIWSSSDGRHWEQVTPEAPWTHGDFAAAVAFQGKMWMLGGWNGGRLAGASATNEVWNSEDGTTWSLATRAPWSARLGMAVVEFKNELWLLGGIESYFYGTNESLKNDVWSSGDGINWTLVRENAPWSPRAYHCAFAFNNRLWVMGGGNYVPEHHALNDVWSTTDGVNWVQETPSAHWAPRIWFSAAVYRGCIWVIGGWSGDATSQTNWGDVWYSSDGNAWRQLVTPSIWTPRHAHSSYVFSDKLWVVGGYYNLNDVWSLWLPKDWNGHE